MKLEERIRQAEEKLPEKEEKRDSGVNTIIITMIIIMVTALLAINLIEPILEALGK